MTDKTVEKGGVARVVARGPGSREVHIKYDMYKFFAVINAGASSLLEPLGSAHLSTAVETKVIESN